MPTTKGIEIIEGLKTKYFSGGYRSKPQGGKDYRFSQKGQAELRRAAKLQAIRHRELLA